MGSCPPWFRKYLPSLFMQVQAGGAEAFDLCFLPLTLSHYPLSSIVVLYLIQNDTEL